MKLSSTPLFTDAHIVSYYPFDGDINDHKGTNNLGGGTPSFITGRYGQAINNTQINNTGISIPLTSAFTVVGWHQQTTLPGANGFWELANSTEQIQVFLGYVDYNSVTYRLQATYSPQGRSVDANIFYNVTLDITRFHHFGITFDGTTMTLYLDGKSVGTINPTVENGNSGSDNGLYVGGKGTYIVTTGGGNDAGLDNTYSDDMGLFTRALTATEIAELATDPSAAFLFAML